MPNSHGWTDEATRNYPADQADRARASRIRDFHERSTMLAVSYLNDPKGYYVEYSRHCDAHADLADDVSEIADYLDEHRRSSEIDDWIQQISESP